MPRRRDDEIPLTLLKPSVIQETRARFDSLLRASVNNDKFGSSEKVKKKSAPTSSKNGDSRRTKKRHKWKLNSSTQKLLTQDEDIFSSNDDKSDQHASGSPSSESAGDLSGIHSTPSVSRTSSNSGPDTPFHSPRHLGSHFEDQDSTLDHVQEYNESTTPKCDSPSVPIPLPRSKRSIRNESRETTSSRISSSDSVKTAIEAFSASNNTVDCSSLQDRSEESRRTSNLKLNSQGVKPKANLGLSPSYEEIDESNLDLHRTKINTSNSIQKVNASKVMQSAVSYEEISEDNVAAKPVSNIQSATESTENSSQESEVQDERAQDTNKEMKRPATKRSKHQRKLPKTADDNESSDTVFRSGKHTKLRRNTKGKHSQKSSQYNYDRIIGVTVHRADALKVNSMIRHPMVRVHFIDSSKGEYLKKSQASRSVSYYNERPDVDFIQPLTCSPCSFKDPRSLIPIWEETLIFNEDVQYILHPDVAILIFFEILDFVPLDVAISSYDKLGPGSGWHRIAWAFLKPRGANNILNINKRVRLQLYKPHTSKASTVRKIYGRCDVYEWWCRGGWVLYPSTLHVSVQSMPVSLDFKPATRSYFALQPEEVLGTLSLQVTPDDDNVDVNILSGNKPYGSADKLTETNAKWSRLLSQSCKIPNKRLLSFPSGIKGCFSLKFSHQGKYLAFSGVNHNMHIVQVFQIPSGAEETIFQGHQGLIYSLEWSPNDELLVTASADCTACVWSLKGKTSSPMQILAHPTFVYNAVFADQLDGLGIFTGCFDHSVRFWKLEPQTMIFQLTQEMNGHGGFVGALCLSRNAALFSGDSEGEIRVWTLSGKRGLWECARVIDIRELRGIVISQIILHPGGKRLLVHARDGLLRMVDINTGVPILWFKGALNDHFHCGACISPCGGLVLSASEDGYYFVWDADTGVMQATYSAVFHPLNQARHEGVGYNSKRILSSSVIYHPLNHMTAFASYGSHFPVVVCVYDGASDGNEIGLRNLCEQGMPDASRSQHEALADYQSAASSEQINFISKATPSRKIMKHGSSRESNDKTKRKTSNREDLEQSKHLSDIISQLDSVLRFRSSVRTARSSADSPSVIKEASPCSKDELQSNDKAKDSVTSKGNAPELLSSNLSEQPKKSTHVYDEDMSNTNYDNSFADQNDPPVQQLPMNLVQGKMSLNSTIYVHSDSSSFDTSTASSIPDCRPSMPNTSIPSFVKNPNASVQAIEVTHMSPITVVQSKEDLSSDS